MLILPLDLIASFTEIAHPGCGLENKLVSLEETLNVKKLVKRFFDGGLVKYTHFTNKVDGLSLQSLVHEFRNSILAVDELKKL
jgi:hypothetical protein